MAKLKDREIIAICMRELEGCAGYTGGELTSERAEAMDYYLQEPLGNEVEGRSQIVTSDVRDTIQWIMPSLMRIFSTQNAVAFSPTGPEDEDAAEQVTDVIRHLLFKKASGFLVQHEWFQDALLQKNGYVVSFWEEKEKTREEAYQGLTDDQISYLANQDGIEFLEYSKDPMGLWSVKLKQTTKDGCISVEGSPPEEILVARDNRHVSVKKSRFVARRRKMMQSELIANGFDRKMVEGLPFEEPLDTEESLSRRHLSDEELDMEDSLHKPSRTIWVTECYPLLDMDDDGITERWKITMAGDVLTGAQASGNVSLLDKERVDYVPIATLTGMPLSHKHYGLSVADIMMDLQEIRTTLIRQILDATYQANSNQLAYNENVIDHSDVMDNAIGGHIPVDGPIDGNLREVQLPGPPQQAFALLEYLDDVRKDRTGVGGELATLDQNTLANINTGVATNLLDEARGKVELIARIFAETGLRELYLDVHKLLREHQDIPLTLKLRNKWVSVRPTEWRERVDMDVKVGIGHAARDQRLIMLNTILEAQKEGLPFGFTRPSKVYHTLSEMVEAADMGSADMFFQNPEDPNAWQPPPPAGPDPQMLGLQLQEKAMGAQAQLEQARLGLQAQKEAADAELKRASLMLKDKELTIDAQLEELKQEINAAKVAAEGVTDAEKVRLESQAEAADNTAKLYKIEADQQIAVLKAAVDKYRADLEAYSGMQYQATTPGQPAPKRQAQSLAAQVTEVAQAQQALKDIPGSLADLYKLVNGLSDRLEATQAPRPTKQRKAVIRDDMGRIVQVGDQRVVRNDDGLIEYLE